MKDILSSAGTVTKFRLMINPETGKPKGYGFADFADADAAASAIRNLNDYEVMGRKIRVDWPHNNEKDSVPPDYSQQAQPGVSSSAGQDGQSSQAPLLPALPPRRRFASKPDMSQRYITDLILAPGSSITGRSIANEIASHGRPRSGHRTPKTSPSACICYISSTPSHESS